MGQWIRYWANNCVLGQQSYILEADFEKQEFFFFFFFLIVYLLNIFRVKLWSSNVTGTD